MGLQKYIFGAVTATIFTFAQGASAQSCSVTNVFGSRVPKVTAASDSAAVELGMKFKMNSTRMIRGLRFYKGSRNRGTHVGNLWSSSGQKLASVTFSNETASGWQTARFTNAVSATQGQTYVISYHAPRGNYAADDQGLATAISNAALTTQGSVFRYGSSSAFPSQTYRATNYYVDVLFDDCATTTPPPSNPPPTNPPPTQPPPTSGSSVSHGSQLTPAMVGPAAIGITSFANMGSVALHDSNLSSYGVNVANTAVYDGVTVTGAHVLIQGKEFGALDIYSGKKIVIRGNKIRGTSYWGIQTRNTATGGTYILYNDMGGHSATQFASKAIQIMGGNAHIYRNYVSYAVDGINFMSDNINMIENYMHNFAGDASAHYDGITNYGGEDNINILRNKILLNKSDTGALNIGAGDASINNWLVDRNYIAGGGYTCYCGGESRGTTSNFKFTNNIFGLDFYPKVGHWGPATWIAPKTRGNLYEGNTYSNGNPLNF